MSRFWYQLDSLSLMAEQGLSIIKPLVLWNLILIYALCDSLSLIQWTMQNVVPKSSLVTPEKKSYRLLKLNRQYMVLELTFTEVLYVYCETKDDSHIRLSIYLHLVIQILRRRKLRQKLRGRTTEWVSGYIL